MPRQALPSRMSIALAVSVKPACVACALPATSWNGCTANSHELERNVKQRIGTLGFFSSAGEASAQGGEGECGGEVQDRPCGWSGGAGRQLQGRAPGAVQVSPCSLQVLWMAYVHAVEARRFSSAAAVGVALLIVFRDRGFNCHAGKRIYELESRCLEPIQTHWPGFQFRMPCTWSVRGPMLTHTTMHHDGSAEQS